MKINKKLMIVFLVLLSTIFLVYAASYYTIYNMTTVTVNEWSVCKRVTDVTGLAIFVPTATATEWTAFRTNKPAGVIVGGCGCYSYALTQELKNLMMGDVGYMVSYIVFGALSPNTFEGVVIKGLFTKTLLGWTLQINLAGYWPQNFFTSIQPYAGAPTYYTSSSSYSYDSVNDETHWVWSVPTTYVDGGTSTVTICS